MPPLDIPDTEPVMRRANLGDMDAVLSICRESFEQSARWQGLRFFACKWWRAALASKAAESWVCLSCGRTAAVCVLVSDELAWKEE
ncbi:unnamed protein product, partial [marine sediment metagenome]